jgi:cytochrome P450
MPYMEAIVLESVRMFMGRTFSIPHRALKDTELQGYHIPKVGTRQWSLFDAIYCMI